jgi:hypothetical protein
MVRAGLTVILSGWVWVCGVVAESVTFKEKLNVPLAEGVPVMAHVVELRERPVGKAPALRAKASGGVPPVAAQVAE